MKNFKIFIGLMLVVTFLVLPGCSQEGSVDDDTPANDGEDMLQDAEDAGDKIEDDIEHAEEELKENIEE